MRSFCLAVLLLIVPSVAFAQTPIKNPNAIDFSSAEHDQVTAYEIDFMDATGKPVLPSLTVPASSVTVLTPCGTPCDAAHPGRYRIDLNVHPYKFGTYTTVMREVSGTEKSDNSVPSAPWSRAPGAPTDLVMVKK